MEILITKNEKQLRMLIARKPTPYMKIVERKRNMVFTYIDSNIALILRNTVSSVSIFSLEKEIRNNPARRRIIMISSPASFSITLKYFLSK
jgi:hypothetical protein